MQMKAKSYQERHLYKHTETEKPNFIPMEQENTKLTA